MTSTVTIKLAPSVLASEIYSKIYTNKASALNLVEENQNLYKVCSSFTVTADGIDAAEEAFDITNNPSRQKERESLYGRGRSVSVGDVVEVDGVNYVCAPTGWIKLV